MRHPLADRPAVAVKSLLPGGGGRAKGPAHRECSFRSTGHWPGGSEERAAVKPFDIPKELVWEAYRRVAADEGAPGVDRQTVDEFEEDMKGNLYKIWNRMSSGSTSHPRSGRWRSPNPMVVGSEYSACRRSQTGWPRRWWPCTWRTLWNPSSTQTPMAIVSDRSALDAVEVCRERCWKKDWVIDLDVAEFFDRCRGTSSIKAVGSGHRHPLGPALVKRWLAAPLMSRDDPRRARQGDSAGIGGLAGPGEPVHALCVRQLVAKKFPACPFEHYADDAVVHCATRRQAEAVLAASPSGWERWASGSTRTARIVYCKDGTRRGDHEHTSFTFLGFTFRARTARSSGTGHCSPRSCLR